VVIAVMIITIMTVMSNSREAAEDRTMNWDPQTTT